MKAVNLFPRSFHHLLFIHLVLYATRCVAQQFGNTSFSVEYAGISASCTDAMNATLACNGMLGEIAVDFVFLDETQLESLCTDSCFGDLEKVRLSIQSACTASTDIIVESNLAYPATYVLDHFIYTFNSTCRKDASSGDFCQLLFQDWINETATSTEQECSDCMLGLSQLELSSPFGYSDEFADNFTSSTSSCGKSGYSFTTPTQYYLNASTTSAAPTTTPTVDCSSTYVIQEGDDCHSISIAHTVSTVSLLMLNDLDAWCANFPTAGSSLCIPYSCDIYTVQENDTCWSIVNDHAPDITMTQLRSWNYNINNKCGNLGQMVGDQICISAPANIADASPNNTAPVQSSATTAAPQPTNYANGTNTYCGKYYTVVEDDYCALVSSQNGIALSDFYFLNPEIDANCTNLELGKAYCVAPVGTISTYSGYGGAVITTGACATAFAPATCFGDTATLTSVPFIAANATISVTRASTTATQTAAPSPTAPGTISGCNIYAEYLSASSEEIEAEINSCSAVASFYEVNLSDLLEWNPSLDNSSSCTLEQGHRYCVQLDGPTDTTTDGGDDNTSTTTTAATPTTTSGVTPPGPTQTGITSTCNAYVLFTSADEQGYCADIASAAGISLSDFVAWNPAVGEACDGLWPGYAYCVGVSRGSSTTAAPTTTTVAPTTTTAAAPTTTTATGVTPPGPTQDGIAAGCTKYVLQQDGVYCYDMALAAGISQDELYELNPALGGDCSGLWPGYAYCVAT